MDGLDHFWAQADAVGRGVSVLLLLMSITAWVLILWKAWVLRRAATDVARGVGAFWAAIDVDSARRTLAGVDREGLLLPLVDAANSRPGSGTLETSGELASQLTRRLRDACIADWPTCKFGQVALASVGSTAPFVGLFGTVWGIYHALPGISLPRADQIEKVSGPVGEALIMTAAGHGGGDSGGAGLQPVRQVDRRTARPTSKASPTTCARWRWTASPAR
jgi:biopolymer transport protein ExbB